MTQVPRTRLLALAALLATTVAYTSGIEGDAANGRALFMSNSCPACHGVTKEATSMVGPSLFGIVGRTAGTAPSLLGASRNLKEYGVIWDAETLDEFLTDPKAVVPGSAMTGVLPDPQERADVIAYLYTLTE